MNRIQYRHSYHAEYRIDCNTPVDFENVQST